jgi:hypothetical protein
LIGAGEGCKHRRERDEHFYRYHPPLLTPLPPHPPLSLPYPSSIILEIKDKSELYSALDMYIQGELVSDVFCDICQDKFNTIKRVVFKVKF